METRTTKPQGPEPRRATVAQLVGKLLAGTPTDAEPTPEELAQARELANNLSWLLTGKGVRQ